MRLFDTHCHLNDEAFRKDREEALERAGRAGVKKMVVVGYDLPSSRTAVALAEKYPPVYAAVGVHPHDARTVTPEAVSEIERLLKREKVVALGEIGLDYHYDHSPREVQKGVFRQFLEIAKKAGKPVIIHDREAHADILTTLKETGPSFRGVMHCYSGSAEMVREFLELGFFISIAGPVTFTNAKKMPEVVRAVPRERLVIETDAPYLAPHPYRGRRNEPLYLTEIACRVAEIRGLTPEETGETTWANACRLFAIRD